MHLIVLCMRVSLRICGCSLAVHSSIWPWPTAQTTTVSGGRYVGQVSAKSTLRKGVELLYLR